MKLLLATTNQGKIKELKELLDDLSFEILGLDDPGLSNAIEDVVEDAPTFAGNALKKALEHGKNSGLLTLADDSGLEIEALGGYPGVMSGRIASTELESLKTILAKMENGANRRAFFRCVIAIYNPQDDRIRLFDGKAEGEIMTEISTGEDGFHFDKIFKSKDLGRCFAEVTMEEKNRVGPRGQALRKAKEYLASL